MKTIDPTSIPHSMRGTFYLCVDQQQPRNHNGTFSAPSIPTTRYPNPDKAAEYGGKYAENGRDVYVIEARVVRVVKLARKFYVQAVAETPEMPEMPESSRSTEDRQQRTEEQPAATPDSHFDRLSDRQTPNSSAPVALEP